MGRFSARGGGGYAPRSLPAPSRPAPRLEPPANKIPSPAPVKTSNYGGHGMYTGTSSKTAQDMSFGISFGIIRSAAKTVLDYVMSPPSNSNDHEIIEVSSTSASTNPSSRIQKTRSAPTGYDTLSSSRGMYSKCLEDMRDQIIGCSYGGSIYEWRSVSAVMKARSASVT